MLSRSVFVPGMVKNLYHWLPTKAVLPALSENVSKVVRAKSKSSLVPSQPKVSVPLQFSYNKGATAQSFSWVSLLLLGVTGVTIQQASQANCDATMSPRQVDFPYSLGKFYDARVGVDVELKGKLYCHLPNEIDLALVAKVNKETADLLTGFFDKKAERYIRQNITHFSARVTPGAEAPSLKYSDFFYHLLFFGDDLSDEGKLKGAKDNPQKIKDFGERLVGFLSGERTDSPETSLERAYARLHVMGKELKKIMGCNTRFIENAFREYIDGNVREVEWRKTYDETGKLPDITEYENWRRKASGVELARMISCFVVGIDPAKVIDRLELKESDYAYTRERLLLANLNRDADLISCYGNDLVSIRKELHKDSQGKYKEFANYIIIDYEQNPTKTLEACHRDLLSLVNERMRCIEKDAAELRILLNKRKEVLELKKRVNGEIGFAARSELESIAMTEKYLKEVVQDFASGCTLWPVKDTNRYSVLSKGV